MKCCLMYTIYCLYNLKHKKIYIGQTIDIAERCTLHNTHFFKNSFTARFDGMWEIIYSESAITRKDALKREKQLKSFKGREFLRTFTAHSSVR